jgi:hypothetical protein
MKHPGVTDAALSGFASKEKCALLKVPGRRHIGRHGCVGSPCTAVTPPPLISVTAGGLWGRGAMRARRGHEVCVAASPSSRPSRSAREEGDWRHAKQLHRHDYHRRRRDTLSPDGLHELAQAREPYTPAALNKLRIVTVGVSGGRRSRGRFATPADFPLHDCSSYSHVHERRESLEFVHRSRAIFGRPVPRLSVTIRNFSSL